MGGEAIGDGVDEIHRGDHADLHRDRWNIVEHRIDLIGEDRRFGVLNGTHAGGVLRGERGDGAHAEYAVGQHGLQIGLNACAAGGIRSGDGEYRLQCRVFHSCLLGVWFSAFSLLAVAQSCRASATSLSCAAASPNFLRMFCEMAMEQNFGPHMEQKCAIFAGSAGSVSSW